MKTNTWPTKHLSTKFLCLSGGIFLWSAAGHFMAYGFLRQMAQEGQIRPLTAIAPGCLYLTGAALLLAAVFAIHPVRPWKRCRRRLCYFAAGYLGIQLLLSVSVGAFAWCLGYFAGISMEKLKTGTDLLCALLQIPIRGAASVLVLQILAGFRKSSRTVFLRAMAAYAPYTFCQYLLTLWQGGIPTYILRILLSAIMTGGLWIYIYSICQKEAAADKAAAAAGPVDRKGGYKR